jgi:hypothetical protein
MSGTSELKVVDAKQVVANAGPETSVRKGFRTLGVVCEALAAATRLIDLMPGNEEGVITREG